MGLKNNAPDNDAIVLEKCDFVFEKSLKSHWILFQKKCGNIAFHFSNNNAPR